MNTTNPLVSIITPCYNGESYVHRLLDSILNQTYKNIEFIFVNDGSTDNTEEIVLAYKDKFEKAGIKFIYIFQENKGLGGAIDAGLKQFTGDYLCWLDSDDYLDSVSIEKRMLFLENNIEYGCVSSNANVFSENNLDVPLYKIADNIKNKFAENHFIPLLLGESIFCSGCHMIRSTAFLDVNPRREIYPARRGQNWQMLLPVFYKYKRAFIDEPLYNYIIYENSMSRRDNTLEKALFRCDEHEEIIKNTLSSINMEKCDKENIVKIIETKYIRQRFLIACKFNDKQLMKVNYNKLKELNEIKAADKMHYYFGKYKLLRKIKKLVKK
jgi:glycosyltransferase involved in cell wall biosynthesis